MKLIRFSFLDDEKPSVIIAARRRVEDAAFGADSSMALA